MILALLFSVFAQAPSLLDDEGLRAAYAGKTHESFYRRNIEEYGGVYFEETYTPEGGVFYRAGDVEAQGRWRIVDGKICFDYPGTALFPGCFVVAQIGGCFYSYEIGADGRPLGLEEGFWWIRAKIKGTDSECETRELVS